MKTIYTILLFGLTVLFSCDKREYLAAKPDQALIVPETLDDLQAILDNTRLFNGMATSNTHEGIVPVLGQASCDDYYVGRPNSYIGSTNMYMKSTYTWQREDIFSGATMVIDWLRPYNAILYANLCLDQYARLPSLEQQSSKGRGIKGTALFHRAHLYYQLAQLFAPVYRKETAAGSPGLILRLKGDVNEVLHRNTLEETYRQILSDLTGALENLPEEASYTTRPTLVAAHGLLARVYLSMSDYPNALLHAEEALQRRDALMDYNELDSTMAFPIPADNVETLFSCLLITGGGSPTAFGPTYASVDPVIVSSYALGDLRRPMFMTKRTQSQSTGMQFKGSYFGLSYSFAGLAIDELYLIKAECQARALQAEEACGTLNALLVTRFDPDSFVALDINDPEEVLHRVLLERRKELLYRGLRWTDLRRLNLDPRFAVTLHRNIDGVAYELPPNDLRYTFPIPADVTGFHPDMPQNPR